MQPIPRLTNFYYMRYLTRNRSRIILIIDKKYNLLYNISYADILIMSFIFIKLFAVIAKLFYYSPVYKERIMLQ